MVKPDLRCPVCFSLNVGHQKSGFNTCRLCGFESAKLEAFRNWRKQADIGLFCGPRINTPNPHSIWRKLGLDQPSTKGDNYSASAIIAACEHQGLPVIAQSTTGFCGLPVPLGRWGERIITQIASPADKAPIRGKLTIGGICQASESEAVAGHILNYIDHTDHFVFVVDTGSVEERDAFQQAVQAQLSPDCTPKDLTILHHPLDDDFGKQRNRVQQAAKTEWVLQLDCDEKLDNRLQESLGWAIMRAENMQLLTMGFPRKNLVDGSLSAHYPDVQYRLNHQTVRFHKPVHEAPDVPWQQVGTCWLGHIEHFLPKARLEDRARKYEKMEKGAGKPANLALLLTDFELPSAQKAE